MSGVQGIVVSKPSDSAVRPSMSQDTELGRIPVGERCAAMFWFVTPLAWVSMLEETPDRLLPPVAPEVVAELSLLVDIASDALLAWAA